MAADRFRYQQALRLGERKIEELGIDSLPVDPKAIAAQHHIVVKPKPPTAPGVSGFLMRAGEQFGIMYATNIDNEGRMRFTIAHELGHYFLPGHAEELFRGGNGLHESRSGFITRDPRELEADHFASGLLMPGRLFSEAMDNAPDGFSGIQTLADICQTSLTATAIRYAALADGVVAVVVSERDRVVFCAMSEAIRDMKGLTWLGKGSVIARDTETFRFNQDRSNVYRARRSEAWSSLDLWLDDASEIEVKEDVVGLGGYGRTLTVLFTDEETMPYDGEEDEDDY